MLNIVPRPTEKAYNLNSKNIYIFTVEGAKSKQEIAKAISEEYKVTVEDVTTLNRKGKATRYSKSKRAYGTTFRADKKIAYVKLKEGDKIKFFEEQEGEKK